MMRKKDQLLAVAVLFAVILSVSAFAGGTERDGLERIRREYNTKLIARTTKRTVAKTESNAVTDTKKIRRTN
ncbi:MAG: hypothetical protein KA715_09045 [Xanthomonadaceae bacterium]|nr:hypothetical protein [Xanthomonadaceae bacterium]